MTDKQIVFAFDLHGVIFQRDYAKMTKVLWHFPHKTRLCLALLNPFLWWSAIMLMYNKGVAEQFIVGLAHKHKRLLPFVPLGITIANTQKPITPMINLLHNLKAQGFQLHIFSNIGSIALADLAPQHPDIFALFSSVTIPSQENGYTRKPNAQAFQNFFANSKSNTENQHVIFIDDSADNIRAAGLYGIEGITFKSPEQVCSQLHKQGI